MFSRLARRTRVLIAVLAIALVAAGCGSGPSATTSGCRGPGAPPDTFTATVFRRTTSDRAARGLRPLSWNGQLWCLANGWSNNMASTGSLTHRNLSTALRSADFSRYRTLGENIAHGPGSMTGDACENAWLASPSHAANIYSGAFTSFGVSAVRGRDGTLWVTANFGG